LAAIGQISADMISLCRLSDRRSGPIQLGGRSVSDENQTRPAALPRDTMAVIGRELRQMYADIIAEGVPERFAEILRKLDEPRHVDSKNDPTPPII
jgi:hypothetical protein